jgi:hypothetical protein
MKLFKDEYGPTYQGIYGLIPLDGIKCHPQKNKSVPSQGLRNTTLL